MDNDRLQTVENRRHDWFKMEKVRTVLAELSKELQRAEDIDIEARAILKELNRDVERLEDSGGSQVQTLLDRVKELESRFAANHPVLERIAGELADAIAKMGI